jgi:hypothetical protein
MCYRIGSQARIQATSMQCSILDTNVYGEFPVPSPVANAFPKRTITTTKAGASAVHGQAVVSPASQPPRFQSVPPVLGVWQLQGALTIMQTIRPNNCGRPPAAGERPSGGSVFWPSASATTCAAAAAGSIRPPHHGRVARHPT